jgi:hypothetical protein
MGVDWYSCETCGETFPDCGDYVWCECGRHWCSDDCAESDGFRQEEDGYTPKGSSYEQETSCNYCRGEEFEDAEVLNLALEILGKSRDELAKILKERKV